MNTWKDTLQALCIRPLGTRRTAFILLFGSVPCLSFTDVAAQQYAISAALIVNGIRTIINALQLKIPFTEKCFGRNMYVGTGVLSVMGTSFTFLPIRQMMADGIDGYTAYGRMLGTSMICGLL